MSVSLRSLRRAVLVAAAALVLPALAFASSHSEAPGTSKDRLIDDTDLYAFVSPDAPDYVTIVGNWVPLLEPASGPNFASFDDDAHYYINVDNIGDAKDHIRFEFTFHTTRQTGATFLYNTGPVNSLSDAHLNVRQFWTLTRVDNGAETQLATGQVAPQFVGPVGMPNYDALWQSAIVTASDGTKIFVGPRDDPFFVDLGAIFDLLTIRNVPGNHGGGIDAVSGYNVMSVVLQVPKTRLTADGQAPNASNSVIGLYDSAERLMSRTINGDGTTSVSGPEVQVSRLGNPLVNEVVIGLADKDRFNASKPTGDAQFLNYVTNPELPGLFNGLYGIPAPPTPRNDLVAVFLTGVPGLNQPANPNQQPCDMLRLNMAIAPALHPNRFGVIAGDVAGFPNGRRLADDVIDIAERVAAGVLVPGFNNAPANQLGDGVDANDVPYLPYFPYVAPPHNPLHNQHYVATPLNRLRGRGRDGGDDQGEDDAKSPTTGGDSKAGLQLAGANPASSHVLQYSIPANGHVRLEVFAANGRLVRTLVDQDAAAGSFRAVWDGRDNAGASVGRGVYFARYAVNGVKADDKKLVIE
jgi:hypothetical protein